MQSLYNWLHRFRQSSRDSRHNGNWPVYTKRSCNGIDQRGMVGSLYELYAEVIIRFCCAKLIRQILEDKHLLQPCSSDPSAQSAL